MKRAAGLQTIWTTLASLDWPQIAGVVSSIAPLITILIAYRALGNWKLTLRNQRIDECISAAFDLIGTLDRFKTIKGRGNHKTSAEAFDQLLASFRDFDRAYTVARRYRPELDVKGPFRIEKFLVGLDYDHPAPLEQRVEELCR